MVLPNDGPVSVITYCGNEAATTSAAPRTALDITVKQEPIKTGNSDDSAVWKAIEKLAPVIQTLLWVFLVWYIVGKFPLQIAQFFYVLANRVKNGSGFKIPGFELFADIRPQPAETQQRIAEKEIQSGSSGPQMSDHLGPSAASHFQPISVAKYLLAEDLALRALQTEYGENIVRNVQTTAGITMDGFFVKRDIPHIIEVKLLGKMTSLNPLRSSAKKLIARLNRDDRFANVRIIFAVVFDHDPGVDNKAARIEKLFANLEAPVDVRVFWLSELEARFLGLRHGAETG